MPIENYVAFIIASVIVLAIPGPSVIMAVGQAVTHGKRAVLPCIIGVGLGDLVATTLSMAGVGSLLLTSSLAFNMLKWVGMAYLFYLGVQMWRNSEKIGIDAVRPTNDKHLLYKAFVVTALNPKGIIFFIAFVPQFIASEANFTHQALICIVTFTLLGIINMWLYTAFAAKARENFQNRYVVKWANRTGGALLIVAAILSGLSKRTA